MRTVVGLVALLLAAGLLATPARADVYTWVDESGTVHFEEQPPPSGKRAKKLRLPQEALPEPQEPEAEKPKDEGRKAPPNQASEPQRPAVRPKPAPVVELFATSWCPYCKKAREYFRRKGIPVVEHDIERDHAALERKIGMDGNQAVPTVVIGDKVIRGYSPAQYEKALEQ